MQRQGFEELEFQTEFRKAAVLALAHAVKPTATFRYHYLMYAIHSDFVAADVEGIGCIESTAREHTERRA
ncbi:MAG: hypothetical protein IPM54_40515 [Polyangiaceae bacterium]|nr:hypothetical protein [Polyangiaceae bacterium]